MVGGQGFLQMIGQKVVAASAGGTLAISGIGAAAERSAGKGSSLMLTRRNLSEREPARVEFGEPESLHAPETFIL